MRRLLSLLALAFALLPGLCAAARYQAVVTHVTDGDTIWVRRAGHGREAEPIRIADIDAPESCQTFGREAREALAARVLQQRVYVATRARDDYQRSVARVKLGQEDVGAWMVSRGYAWAYRFGRRSSPYGALEARARDSRLGLWKSPQPEEPRAFRHRHGSCH